MQEEVSASRPRETEQEGADDPDNLLFPDDSEKDRIVEYSPQERFYRFNEEIGFGSYKSVYRGHDSDTGREIAWNVIKLMRLPPQQRKRLTEEIYILRNISHKKIISFINAWLNKNKNEMIFITEMVSGGSLKKHLRKIKKPRLKIVKGWCREILEGLNYLHSQKPSPIIHRDIKCENIFINTNTNEIRIGDLGLAIFTRDSYAETLIGTPQFMAPEIFEGKYSTGVDIYAFGMCVLEMATLETPYQQCKGLPQIYKHIEQRIKPKSLDLIESDSLRNFISKCLNDSKDRPSAAELLQDEFFLPEEDDKKEVQLRPTHSIIQEVSPELESTLKKSECLNRSLTPMEQVQEDIQEVMMRHSRHNLPAHPHPLASSAEMGKHVLDQPLKRQCSNDMIEKCSPESPQSASMIKIKDQVTAEFRQMYQAYRKKIMPQVQQVHFTGALNAFEQSLLRELQESSSSPVADQSEKLLKNQATPHQKDSRKIPTRKNSSDKLDKKTENELETKSMMEVNQTAKKQGNGHKWADNDFDFISPQNQSSCKQTYLHAYSQHQNKHPKNISIPTSIPPPPTKNATKLAEIANKIKVELPKQYFEPKEDELRNRAELPSKTSDPLSGKYKQQLLQAPPQYLAPEAGAGNQPFDLQRQLAEKAKKDSKSSPKSTEPSSAPDPKQMQSRSDIRSPGAQNQFDVRQVAPPQKEGESEINIDKRNVLSIIAKAKTMASQPANPQPATAGIRSPQQYLIPGMMSSAPTSPTPAIQQVLASTTPTSPPPNIQQQQVLWSAQGMSHPQVHVPQQNIPSVQPFTHPISVAANLAQPMVDIPVVQQQTSSTTLERSESMKTSPQTIDLLSGSVTPKEQVDKKQQIAKHLQRARTEEYQPDFILLTQARRKQKDGMKFPISKQASSKEDVMMLQNILSKLMDEKLEAIGVFGHYTEELVKRFQENNRLKVDGVVDQHMYMLMIEQLQRSSKQADKERQLSEKQQRQRQQTNELSRKLMSQMEAEVLKKE